MCRRQRTGGNTSGLRKRNEDSVRRQTFIKENLFNFSFKLYRANIKFPSLAIKRLFMNVLYVFFFFTWKLVCVGLSRPFIRVDSMCSEIPRSGSHTLPSPPYSCSFNQQTETGFGLKTHRMQISWVVIVLKATPQWQLLLTVNFGRFRFSFAQTFS